MHACLTHPLQLYGDEAEAVRLNEMLDVVAVLWADPQGGRVEDEPTHELDAFNPPPSLIPRLHALYYSTLQHGNPLVPSPVPRDRMSPRAVCRVVCHVPCTYG